MLNLIPMNVGLDYVVLSVEEEGGGRRRKSHSAGGNARADLVMVPHGHSQHVRMLLMPEKQQELTHVMSEWKRRLIAGEYYVPDAPMLF